MKRIVLTLTLVIACTLAVVGWKAYDMIYGQNVPTLLDEEHLLIPTGTSFDSLVVLLENGEFIIDKRSFERVAGWMKFQKDFMPPGRFRIIGGWSNRELISHIRSGDQDPVEVTFNNVRNIEELAGKVADYIEPDSFEILQYINNEPLMRSLGYTRETALCLFIPNTYELYWNTSVDNFLHRMKKENEKFWGNRARLKKAEDIKLTPSEVYTLASIVEKETLLSREKKTIAGVYMNRLKKGIRLQADPTVVFAVGDFTIRRVLNKHLAFDSPYNTYIYGGLPPGPICMPEIESIDAVLNAEEHDFLYFCAEPGYTGAHAFAKTLSQHMSNARTYQSWLRQERIK